MLFSSVPFLFYFLPAVMLCYFVAPKKLKNAVLLVFSLLFYAWGEPRYVFLMAFSIVMGYVFGLLIEKYRGKKTAKLLLAASVVISIGLLGYFKYADFFIGNFNAATGLSLSLLKIALPIGISFYTFQILSYTIDVYRGNAKARRNIVDFGAYVALFPQLIAGPIVRYTDIDAELTERTHSFEKAAFGIERFVVGLGKKVLISNAFGELCSIFRASGEKSVLFYWVYAAAFTLQIYFDFSGYSDMAIGLGRIFGFHFPENFDYPYISRSITEFWRRWHMSLGSWFRDYVYIPLGGNRVSKPRWFFNIFAVWMLTGFWHGADWQFIAWGLMYAVLLIIEKLFFKKALERLPAVIGHIYVMFFVITGFVLFNAEGIGGAVSDICAMFGAGNLPLVTAETLYYLRSYAVIFAVGIIGATPLLKIISDRIRSGKGERFFGLLRPVLLCGVLLLVTAYLVDGSFNPFLYFRF
ncbi:MAG: MBOAT family O-acyltransferase [Oscillospiraceae bacterium]